MNNIVSRRFPVPIYEYTCDKCGQDFEELVSLSSAENPKCPKCGDRNTHRKMSAFACGGGGKSSGAFSGGGSCAPSGG